MFSEKNNIQPFGSKIWLSSPSVYDDSMEYVMEAYKTNWMSTVGQNINEIERLIAEKIGCKYAVALTCGTAALHMALKLTGVGAGDTVLCSDLTFLASVTPVIYEDAVPVLVDSEYDTWNMDPVTLERAFQRYPSAKVCVLVHLYGTPGRLDEIQAVCDKYGAVLVEDAAESFGATYKGVQTGKFGKTACISFNGNKIITGTSGGLFLTDEKEMADKVRKWSTQSREKAPWYQHEELGYNYRMSNVIAGIVRGQLPHLEEHIAQKKAIYERYKEGLKNLPVQMNPYDEANSEPNHWLSCMIINPDAMCQQVRGDMESTYVPESGKSCPTEILEALARHNTEGRPIWKPMHMQPLFQQCDFVTRDANLDVGRDIFERGVCLPSDNKMTAEEQDKIIQIIQRCFE